MTGVASAGPPALELADVRYAYPDGHEALCGISLRVEPGERVAGLGPNGAGKSTLWLQLNGIRAPTERAVSAGAMRVGG